MDKNDKFLVRCACGCSVLSVDKWDVGEPCETVSVGYYTSGHNSLWQRIKSAWKIVSGNDYCLWEIYLENDELDDFKDFINQV